MCPNFSFNSGSIRLHYNFATITWHCKDIDLNQTHKNAEKCLYKIYNFMLHETEKIQFFQSCSLIWSIRRKHILSQWTWLSMLSLELRLWKFFLILSLDNCLKSFYTKFQVNILKHTITSTEKPDLQSLVYHPVENITKGRVNLLEILPFLARSSTSFELLPIKILSLISTAPWIVRPHSTIFACIVRLGTVLCCIIQPLDYYKRPKKISLA